ncbi:MAG: hypothetical protein ACOYBY_16895 [Dermatophilaceae bacterium]
MSPGRRAALILAGVAGLIVVVVVAVFLAARSATTTPTSAAPVTVTQTASTETSPQPRSPATASPSAPPSADPQAPARQSLVEARSRALQGLSLNGRWVLQLSSKSDGIVDEQQTAANGTHTFHFTDIQAQFDQLSALARNAGMVPMVVTANDFGTKRTPNGDQLWVLLADAGGLSSKDAAQAACARLFPQLSGAALSNACVPRTLVPLP